MTCFNVGGSVWAMDWCPQQQIQNEEQEETEIEKQYIAIGSHSNWNDYHKIGKKYTGKHVIQIWEMEYNKKQGKIIRNKIVYGIVHDGGCIWDLKWCPQGEINNKGNEERMGLLAVATGDGTLSCYPIPFPNKFINQMKLNDDELIQFKNEGLFIKLNKVFENKYQSPIQQISWSIHQNSNWLLIGDSDGFLYYYNLNLISNNDKNNNNNNEIDNGEKSLPVISIHAHNKGITGIGWSPSNRNIIVTTSRDAYFKVWDIREPFRPVFSHQIGGGYLTSVDWGKPVTLTTHKFPFAVLGMEENSVRLFDIERVHCRTICDSSINTIWDVHLNYYLPRIASVGADGRLQIINAEHFRSSSKRVKQPPLLSIMFNFIENDNIIHLTDSTPIIPIKTTSTSASPVSKKKSTPKKKATTPKSKKSKNIENDENENEDIDNDGEQEINNNNNNTNQETNVTPKFIFPDPIINMQKIRWNPNKQFSSWFAMAGSAGVVYLCEYNK